LRVKDGNTDNPHGVTKAQVGLANVTNETQIPLTQKGAANGVAELDANGFVPSTQLPSFVDEVEEHPTLGDFPATGVDGRIYVAEDTNLAYRWSGSAYVEIAGGLTLGETSSTAYRGDRGKIAYDHSQVTSGNPHNVTAGEITDFQTSVSSNADVMNNTAEIATLPTELLRVQKQVVAVKAIGATSYTLLSDDAGKYLRFTAATAVNFSIIADTVEEGDVITIRQAGAGQITLVAGTGVTLNVASSEGLKTAEQGAEIQFTCVDDTLGAHVFDVRGGVA